jgi:hypothetical protein
MLRGDRYSITRSARVSTDGGIVMPSARNALIDHKLGPDHDLDRQVARPPACEHAIHLPCHARKCRGKQASLAASVHAVLNRAEKSSAARPWRPSRRSARHAR